MNERTRTRLATAVACTTMLALAFGCVESVRDIGYESADGDGGPIAFTPSPDGAADGGAAPSVPMCMSTECSLPYATCPDKSGLCNTNLNYDLNNCGACGNKCQFALDDAGVPTSTPSGVLNCENGKCGMICEPETGDCNGQVEDGCEARLRRDEQNCGACGNACKDGELCWRGVCGCPPGYTRCGDQCTQLDRDAKNCSVCGNLCVEPELDAGPGKWPCGAGVLPPHVGPVCLNSACQLNCTGDFTGTYDDCNSDICGDGCETNVNSDPNNCGACGKKCLPDQRCVSGECECAARHETLCGTCTDLMKDPNNCGACGNVCPGPGDSYNRRAGHPICVLGRCSYYCPPGRADCDHRIENCCETDLNLDPANCGSCGAQCDLEAGQPCAAGRCLTKPCEDDGGGVH
jgi:hypothetical protein